MKLEYNKVINLKTDIYEEDEHKKLKEKKRRQDKNTLGRPEWVYFLWYLHLKLCLEMEEKKISLQIRKKYRSGVHNQRQVSQIFRLRINRSLYKGIDWDELKSLNWNQWKKRYLNVFREGDIQKIEHGDEWKCEPQYLYLEVDLRNTETVLVNQLKKILSNEKRINLPSKLGIQGKPNYHSTILGYNLIVGIIEGNGWKKVLEEDNLKRLKNLISDENYNTLVSHLKDLKDDPNDIDSFGRFEGFCFSHLNRYVLETQRVLYNVSQGRFFDKTDIPKEKWKDSWSKKTYLW